VATGLQGEPWLAEQAKSLAIQLGTGPAGFGMRLEADAQKLAPLFNEFYDFKMEFETPIGTLRSFCCNQNGYIVNENHNTLGIRNVNGHSNLSPELRSNSSNFAIIAKIYPNNLMMESPQAYVKNVAMNINRLGDGMPCVQSVKSFINGVHQEDLEGNLVRTNFQTCDNVYILSGMPPVLAQSFRKFLLALDKALPDGLGQDAVVYAPEIKYYGQRFPVDENWKSTNISNLYVTGNASGYLDSYVAAAVSGMIAARDITKQR